MSRFAPVWRRDQRGVVVIGQKIGPYQVLSKLGEGGMGDVYRARDTKLDRDVAPKILPASFASDPDRLMRFEREAKTLASLNHPNIAQVYGVQESRSPGVQESGITHAIVMELVEGRDLSEVIAGVIFGAPGLQARGLPGSKDPGLHPEGRAFEGDDISVTLANVIKETRGSTRCRTTCPRRSVGCCAAVSKRIRSAG